jgi:phosphatidylserine/phosphatidylglycerophosphate/cardiolipin synthase-like enzyme
MHCHHEKLVVVDDRVAFVGGIDLTSLAGDRYDSTAHPARGRLGWHDVAARLEGPVVADVAAHFAGRWRDVAGESLAPPVPSEAAGETDVQLVRTVPERLYGFLPRGDFRIVEAYLRALRSAERFVYLENQFLWSPEVTRVLAAKLRDPPRGDFRIVLVLPAKANNGEEDTRGQLGALAQADEEGGGGRLLACTVRSRTDERVESLYVHAKVGIVDDRWLTLGSANLNAHSFFNDSEVNVVTCDPDVARGTRLALWSEHLELPLDDVGGDPADLFDRVWAPVARRERQRSARGEPATHRLIELPGVSRRTARLRGPLDALVVDG